MVLPPLGVQPGDPPGDPHGILGVGHVVAQRLFLGRREGAAARDQPGRAEQAADRQASERPAVESTIGAPVVLVHVCLHLEL